MEEESASASNNGAASAPVSESAVSTASDVKLSAALPEIPAVTVSTSAIAATVQS